MTQATATSFKDLRAQIESELKAQPGLKGWVFYKAAESVDESQSKPGLLLIRTSFTKLSRAGHTHALTLWLIAPQHTTEDQLDDWADALIQALDATPTFANWDAGDRADWSSQQPGYRITITANTTIREA